MPQYQEYLRLLRELCGEIKRLTELGKKQLEAVQEHDLDALDVCMKQMQAASLTLRGLEQKRKQLQKDMELDENLTLREMSLHCPKEYQRETDSLIAEILSAYQVLRSTQEPARTMMERDLRAIKKELEARGIQQETEDHYRSGGISADPRTDFRV